MALVTETGTGASNSESYCSVADATTYHANRGNSTWALLTTAQMEESLRRATDYMEQVYRLNWLGSRVTITQALSWPRDEVQRADFTYLNQYSYYANNVVPTEVKNACADLAIKAAAGDLAPDLSRRTIREKVDVIEVEYSDYGTEYIRYRAIDNLLAPFLGGSSGAIRKVVR